MNRYTIISCLIFFYLGISFPQNFPLKYYPSGHYNEEIPYIKDILGFSIGERPIRYDEAIRYMKLLSEKSSEVQMVEFGTTYEKRKLYYLIISSQENMSKLDGIRNSISKLSDPRKIIDTEAEKIVQQTPAIAWLAYGIHGDELSGPDAAILLAYHLAAGIDSVTIRLKKELVIIIDPMENPDGRERYLAQMQQWAGEVVNSDAQDIKHTGVWPWGRGNHYLFDLNRDWFLLVHPETRARVSAILQWNPQIFVDAHEMSSYDTYLFSPAGPPLNPNINDFNMKWRKKFAIDQAKAFDKYGWSYYTREWNDEWYPGYGSGWSLYIGAVGILYEQAQTDGSLIKRPDGTYLYFSDAVFKQFTSSMANLSTAAMNKNELLKDYYEAKKLDMKKLANQAFLIIPDKNQTRLNNFLEKLLIQKIEIKIAEKDFSVKNVYDYWKNNYKSRSFPKGTFIIPLDQPMGRLAKTILEFDPRMDNETLEKERKSLEKEKRSTMYDITAWSLPIAYGLDCYWTDKKVDVSANYLVEIPYNSGIIHNYKPSYGYIFDIEDDKAFDVIARLLEKGYKIRSAKKEFVVENKPFNRGTILIRLNENDESIHSYVKNLSETYNFEIFGVNTALSYKGPDLGGNDFVLLETPRIALVTGSQISMGSFGTIWHLLDYKIKQRITIITTDGLNSYDLRKYNVIILPSANSPQSLGQLLGKDGIIKLRKWIENGGTLIAIDNSASFCADTSTGLSKVRLRHQALTELEIYSEWVMREESIERIKIDSLKFWNGIDIKDTLKDKKSEKKDHKTLEREEEWLRLFMPRGAIISVDLDEEHWLAFGLGKKIPVIFYGSNVFLSKDPVQTVGRFSDILNLRISGLVWNEAKQRLAKTAFSTRETLGYGQIILFAEELNFRSFFHSTERLLLNAIYLGPGFGTSKTVDW